MTTLSDSADRASDASATASTVVLCGGVGAARFLRGLVQCQAPEDILAIVNTGDDGEFYGVHVAPDLDIVTYTLAGIVDPERGYGVLGDRYTLMDRLAELGHEVWFQLGDRDFAHCLHRSLRLREGIGLAEITRELCRAYGVHTRLLPMSEAPCPTRVELDDGRRMHFEEYLIREGSPDAVRRVDLDGARHAQPCMGLFQALSTARRILIAPSNPVVSIGPILALPGVRKAVCESRAPVVAVSPIVGGAAIKGPAAQLLRGVGAQVSAQGVAAFYGDLIQGFVFDERDRSEQQAIRALGLATRCTDSIMVDPEAAARLARSALELAESLH